MCLQTELLGTETLSLASYTQGWICGNVGSEKRGIKQIIEC